MKLEILIGKIKRSGSEKEVPLKLGDPVDENDTVTAQTKHGQRVIRCIAMLTAKEADKRRVKTWAINYDHRVSLAAEEIRKSFEAQAARWKEKIMAANTAKLLGESEPKAHEVALLSTEPTFDPKTDLLA